MNRTGRLSRAVNQDKGVAGRTKGVHNIITNVFYLPYRQINDFYQKQKEKNELVTRPGAYSIESPEPVGTGLSGRTKSRAGRAESGIRQSQRLHSNLDKIKYYTLSQNKGQSKFS